MALATMKPSRTPVKWLLLSFLPLLLSLGGLAGDSTLLPEDLPVEGRDVTLRCRMHVPISLEPGLPVWFWWMKNGLVVESAHMDTLTIHNASLDDEGVYACSVRPEERFPEVPIDKSTYILLLKVPPVVSITQKRGDATLTVPEGGVLTLTCQVTNEPKPPVGDASYTWTFQRQGSLVERQLAGKSEDLTLQPVHRGQSGRYSCSVAKDGDFFPGYCASTSSVQVLVQCAPSIPGGSTQTRVLFRVGENVTLAVQVLANPAPTYTWSGPGLGGGHRSASLTLVSLETRHSGRYSVTVSNRLGSLVHVFLLIVETPEGQLELKVGGGVAASLLCLLGLVSLLCCRRRTRLCSTVKGGASASGQGQDREAAGCSHDAGRGGAREEGLGADLGTGHFGHNTGHNAGDNTGDTTEDYCSIHSADLDLQPQPDPALPSSTQDTPEVSYDVPPPAVRVTSPGTCVSRDKEPITAVDSMATDDIMGGSPSDESQDSDSYLACHVVSQGLLYSSLTPHSPDPQTQYLTPHSPDPQTHYLIPHSPDPQTQY